MSVSDLKPGDKVEGRLQNLRLFFKVTSVDQPGPKVWLEHQGREVHVRKQDLKQYGKEIFFLLEVKNRP